MRKLLSLFLFFVIPLSSFAQEGSPQEGEITLEMVLNTISGLVFTAVSFGDVSIPLIVAWLIVGAVFFTITFRFINIRGLRHSFDIVRGKYSHKDDPGEVTHFQALATALSATVGLGNIAGVAVAVSMGGAGATFWMIIAGLLGMSSKFVECALAVKYRYIHADGSVAGGPMYYLSKGLPKKGSIFKWLGPFMAIFFSVMAIGGSFGGGNMFQINQATSQLTGVTQGTMVGDWLNEMPWLFGGLMAFLVGIVIIGGVKSIAKVTDKIVPFMTITYLLSAVVVLVANAHRIPFAVGEIIDGAFSADAVCGGILGGMIMGFKRAAFSNEAGVGSAAIAHSAVKTHEPVSEGFVALLEPFIDTVIVCTMTALVIIIGSDGVVPMTCEALGSGVSPDGIQLTSDAFGTVITWFPTLLTMAVTLFAFSTMISWSYYGLKSWEYVFGEGRISSNLYKLLFCTFTVIGSFMQLDAVIGFSDSMIFMMSVPNVFGCYVLSGEVRADLKDFLKRISTGEIKTYK